MSVPPIGDRLRLAPICQISDGAPAERVLTEDSSEGRILTEGWDVDFESPNPLLLLALLSQHNLPQ